MTRIKFDTGKLGEALQKCVSTPDDGALPCDDCPLYEDVVVREACGMFADAVVGVEITMSPCLMTVVLAKRVENRLNEGEGLD